MRILTAGAIIGMGLGGFIDGIALHQIAQWHNMGSAILPPTTMAAMSQNMAWDGWFHLGTWTITIIGVFMLWNEGRSASLSESGRVFTGQLIFGWGAFNLAEGTVNHHLLELHHVRDLPAHVPLYDWLFLVAGGAGLLALGLLLMLPGRPRAAVTPP